ncbi:chemotaxis protein [Colwellia sp. 75C3]|uniref:HD-GYP domain-containing protein n=1 Tax=Colwellia sp. 75C3 TaxID=888425 RepID=UPI000C31BD83|nr:HD domain-containing phosphohydrolase [Colwellia sp. 75C3]PKG82739.1 chemotaxis protein [Colwellia sp. 75C3]
MKGLLKGFKLSLTSYVSLAFIFFLFISAGTLVAVNYYRMSVFAFEETLQQFDRAIKLEAQSIRKHLTPVYFRLKLQTNVDKWQYFSAYQNNTTLLFELANYIAIDPLSIAVHVGFKNGNFVSVKKLLNEFDRQQYQAPSDAHFAFEVLEYFPNGESKSTRNFLNFQLEVIGSTIVGNSTYEIFNRPWYVKGLNAKEISVVAPYQEYQEQHRMISLVLSDREAKVVHAVDINVLALAELMKLSNVTDSDVQIILSTENEILAHQRSGDFHLDSVNDPAIGFSAQDKRAIKNFAKSHLNQVGLSEVYLSGELWMAKIALLNPIDKASTKLFIATPKAKVITSVKESLFDELLISCLIILLFIPFTWLFSGVIVRPVHRLLKNTHKLAGLQFSQVSSGDSFIEELNELEQDMLAVSNSLQNTFSIINMLAKEKNMKVLAEKICSQACEMLKADAALIFLTDKDTEGKLLPCFAWGHKASLAIEQFSPIDLSQELMVNVESFLQGKVQFSSLSSSIKESLIQGEIYQQSDRPYSLFLPLIDRDEKINGLLGFSFTEDLSLFEREQYSGIATALSKYISVAIEGSELFESQKELMKSFIQLIAGAIDIKSPYTGAHCQRVPTLTMMLAEEATKSKKTSLKDFTLTHEQWGELKISAWLHDCGKVTTPENVVDKATKLEAIYNRVHEVRMRFEVLRRDAQVQSLQQIIAGENQVIAQQYLAKEMLALEDDFAFIAQCNLGEEMMSAQAVDRINQISQRKWLRYFDDSLGLSSAEKERMPATKVQLPVEEFLLADKDEHCIEHIASHLPAESDSTFTMEIPEYRFNLGEVNNLSITRGTINNEERYIINHHIVQTIEMLEQLPFPENLKRVPEIAGAHHEQLNGKGYPKGLKGDEISIESRILTIADIFEALTASDRPYKTAKTLSQSIAILDHMRKTEHIDNDLFELFLSSGVYTDYANKFLSKDQIDTVDINQYLSN